MKPVADTWSLIDPIRSFERTIAAGLIDDSLGVTQRCRAAGIAPDDFAFDPFAPIARAAFAAVDLAEWPTLNHYRRIDILARATAGLCDRRLWSIDDVLSLGSPSAREVSAAIGRLAGVARHVRVARQHRAAVVRSMSAAYRIATEDRHDVQADSVVDRRARDVAGEARQLPATRDVRAVGSLPGVAGRSHPPSGEGQRRTERMDAQDAQRRQRQTA